MRMFGSFTAVDAPSIVGWSGARRRRLRRPTLIVVALAALAAGCSMPSAGPMAVGQAASPLPSPSSSAPSSSAPPAACPASELVESLVAPAPGATGVPVDVGVLYVEGHDDGTYTLEAVGGTIAAGRATAVPSPAPSAAAFASFAVPVPTLSAATIYTVHYQAAPIAPGACPSEYTTDLGSFTTR